MGFSQKHSIGVFTFTNKSKQYTLYTFKHNNKSIAISIENINSKNKILERQISFKTSTVGHAVLLHLDKDKHKITIYNTGGNNKKINKLLDYIDNNEKLKNRLAEAIGCCKSNELNINQKDYIFYEQNGSTCDTASGEVAMFKYRKRIMAERLRNKLQTYIEDYENKKDKFETVIKQLKQFMKKEHKYFTEEGLDKIANDIKNNKIEIDEKNEYKKFLEINKEYIKDIGINTLIKYI